MTTNERTLPIPAEHREFHIKVDGEAVAREHQLSIVSISKTVNRIASARLVYLDGAASSSDFPLSNAETFLPGAAIEILSGAASDPVSLFHGIVVGQRIKLRENAAPQLIVECRHAATKLTVGPKSAYYFEQTDSEVMGAILEQHGIEGEVEETSVTHPELVQYDCTDWDFLVTRAEANGKFIFTNDDTIEIKEPSFDGSPVAALQFGATILEMDCEMDARLQLTAVKSFTWDAAQQEVAEVEAAADADGPGNLSSEELAMVASPDFYSLRHGPIAEPESQAWADAWLLKSKMSKVNGRAKCEGIGNVNPGDIVTMDGVGERFRGDAFVTGIRHDFDLVQGWKTHVQFGTVESWLGRNNDVSAPKAGGLLPGINGLQTGIVVSNEDPEGEFRVRVKMPMVSNSEDGTWARVASVDAGDQRGFFCRPEVGDEVILGFLNDDPRHAVVLGMLNSSAKPAPLEGSDDNHEKVLQTRSEMKIYFNDDTKVMQLMTPAENAITLSEEDEAILIQDQHGNKIEMNADGIKIESVAALELVAGTELKIESGTELAAKGGTELKLEGAAGAEISSSAITKVKGSLVQLN